MTLQASLGGGVDDKIKWHRHSEASGKFLDCVKDKNP